MPVHRHHLRISKGRMDTMEFIDLAAQQKGIRYKVEANIRKVLDHGKYIMGPEISELERRLASYVGVKHGIGCASGTDALLMALMAYNIGPGDAVFTTPFTFVATAEVISLLGATPVFVDIDADTYNIDPKKLALAIAALKKNDPSIYPLPNADNKLTSKGIIPVDLFGLLADYEAINDIASQDRLFIIEDAAQSFGAEYQGKKAGAFGHIACTSFFPAKPLGCYGDGGMCFTNDDDLMKALLSIRIHGQGEHKYDNVRIGINGRLDTLQAAILLAKLDIFPEEIKLRHDVAQRYSDGFAEYTGIKAPFIPRGANSVWAQYSILAKDGLHRDVLMNGLQQAKIPSAIYYPKALHRQEAYACLGYKTGDFPVSEDCASRIFSLPMHPYLKKEEQATIIGVIKNAAQ